VLGTEIKKKFHFRLVETSIMPIGNTNIHTQNNVPVFIKNLIFITVL